jgi:hypothetical protein
MIPMIYQISKLDSLYHKVIIQNTIRFAEVQFYFRINVSGAQKRVALVSLFGPPDTALRAASYETLLVCKYHGDDALMVVDAKAIVSVVAMVPFSSADLNSCRYFVVEKIGLDVAELDDSEMVPDNE